MPVHSRRVKSRSPDEGPTTKLYRCEEVCWLSFFVGGVGYKKEGSPSVTKQAASPTPRHKACIHGVAWQANSQQDLKELDKT